MVRKLKVTVDDELEKEMSRYLDVDWAEVIRKGLRGYIRNRDIREVYTAPIVFTFCYENNSFVRICGMNIGTVFLYFRYSSPNLSSILFSSSLASR